jgi:hypothetical protein
LLIVLSMLVYILIAIIYYFLAGALNLKRKVNLPIYDKPLMYHKPLVLAVINSLSLAWIIFLITTFVYNWMFALILWISGLFLAPKVFAPIVEMILYFIFARK